jgi:hypothetical protein
MGINFTSFGIIIVVITFIITVFASDWLLPLLVFVLPFQAASVVNITLGGYPIGIQPGYFVGLVYLFYGLATLFYSGYIKIVNQAVWVYAPLFGFIGYLCLSTLLIPRILAGQISVFPPRAGISVSSLAPLYPSTTNLSQMFYLVLAVALAFLITHEISQNKISIPRLRRAFIAAGILVALLGFYQVLAWTLKLYFPYNLLYTNPSYALLGRFQTLGDIKRLSATLAEGSLAAFYLVGVFGYLFGEYLAKGTNPTAMLIILLAVLMTFSTSGYFALAILAVWSIWLARRDGLLASRLNRIFVIGISLAILVAVLLLITGIAGRVLANLGVSLWEKANTISFSERIGVDLASLNILWSTLGIGAGWGSNRASSMIVNLLSNGGLWGSILVFIFFYRVWKLTRLQVLQNPIIKGLAGSLIAMFSCGLAGVPDLSVFFIWVNLGWMIGYTLKIPYSVNTEDNIGSASN